MKNFIIDFLWFLLFIVIVGIVEFIFKLMFGWALSWSTTIQAIFIFIGTPTFFGILGIGAGLVAIVPFKTKFWLVISEIGLLMELIGGLMGIWGKWWWYATGGWDIAIKVVATLIFLEIFLGGGIALASSFMERKND